MQTKLANDTFRERYVVEIDGIAKSEYSVFVKALTASLQLKQEFPYRSVKLRDADAEGALACLLTLRVVAVDQVTSRISYPTQKQRHTALCAPRLDKN